MVNRSLTLTSRFTSQAMVCIIIFILLCGITSAQNDNNDWELSISHPSNIPLFDEFSTPTIDPGNTGKLQFSIRNRYNLTEEDDNTMYNVTLFVEVYTYLTLETKKDITDISKPPEIVDGNLALKEISPDKLTAEFYWQSIKNQTTVDVELKIKSFADTPEGRYYVRMHLNFLFYNTYFDMKSRGHFSDATWDRATINITEQERLETGRLKLDVLDVDGVITETSFRVITPIPRWPLYILIGFAGLFIVLAIIFYFMDEKGYFPRTKKKLDNLGKKVEDIRYRRK